MLLFDAVRLLWPVKEGTPLRIGFIYSMEYKKLYIVGNGQHLRIRYIRNGKEKVIVYIEQMIPAADSGE